jgi:two-component system, NtrC family, sensor kinase
VARPWRLRHKLVFGLALVVASIGFLFGGAALGLTSYFEASRLTNHKLDQMMVIIQMRENIHVMASSNPRTRQQQQHVILHHLKLAEGNLDYYRVTQKRAAELRRYDPDNGESEQLTVDRITSAMGQIQKELTTSGARVSSEGDGRLIDEPKIRQAYSQLLEESTTLFSLMRTDIEDSLRIAEADRRRGTIIASIATFVALVLVLTLLYYFRVWVFTPIRQLQAGVQRVHAGDFNSPIRLASQDELEELANEFNAMTTRLRDMYADLAQQVNERSRQLVRSERMVSVGFLAAGVAHEINNPLASIAFCSEALERRVAEFAARMPASDAEAVTKYLKVIQQEAFRCKQITQKLLDFSRSGEGRREATDLSRLVQDVIDVARPLPNCRGKQIHFTPSYLMAAISPPDIKSVVLNLVVNALDSMDEGGVLSVAIAQTGEFAEMIFRDTGCGMTPEVLENLFEPFFTRKRTGNGTGLGLSISHQIIDQHGGNILALSDGPGMGSTFVVRVPVKGVIAAVAKVTELDVLPYRVVSKKAA